MSPADYIIKGVMRIEQLRSENVSIEAIMAMDSFPNESVESVSRMKRITNQGKMQIIKAELRLLTDKYLK